MKTATQAACRAAKAGWFPALGSVGRGVREASFADFSCGSGHEFAIRELQMGAEKYGSGTWFGARGFCRLVKSRTR